MVFAHQCRWQQRSEAKHPLLAEVTDHFDLPGRFWEPHLDSLEGKQVLLTTEASLCELQLFSLILGAV